MLSGQNKMVINHLEKLFVTNDAATIIRELEVSYCEVLVKTVYVIVCVDSSKITHHISGQ